MGTIVFNMQLWTSIQDITSSMTKMFSGKMGTDHAGTVYSTSC